MLSKQPKDLFEPGIASLISGRNLSTIFGHGYLIDTPPILLEWVMLTKAFIQGHIGLLDHIDIDAILVGAAAVSRG